MEVSPPLFGILLYHISSGEHHWLTPGFSVLDLITSHCGKRPLEEWRFEMNIKYNYYYLNIIIQISSKN